MFMLLLKIIPAITLLLIVAFGLIPTAKYLIQNRKRVAKAVNVLEYGTYDEKRKLLNFYDFEYDNDLLDKSIIEKIAIKYEKTFTDIVGVYKRLSVYVEADEACLTKARCLFHMNIVITLVLAYLFVYVQF